MSANFSISETKTLLFKKTLVFIIATHLMSCTKISEEIDLPELPAPVVVSEYLHPGMHSINVYVHRAYSLNNAIETVTANPVKDAVVSITNELYGEVNLNYNETKGLYEVYSEILPIIAGQTYALSISIAEHPTIESEVRVPYPHADFGIELSSSNIGDFAKEYFLQTFINDSINQQNRYQLFGTAEIIEVCETDSTLELQLIHENIFDYSSLISDQNRDGQTIHQSAYIYVSDKHYPYYCSLTPNSIQLKLMHLESFTYDYLKALEDFEIAIGDPFAQYVVVPTNLTNAQGVFGAFTITEKLIPWSDLE